MAKASRSRGKLISARGHNLLAHTTCKRPKGEEREQEGRNTNESGDFRKDTSLTSQLTKYIIAPLQKRKAKIRKAEKKTRKQRIVGSQCSPLGSTPRCQLGRGPSSLNWQAQRGQKIISMHSRALCRSWAKGLPLAADWLQLGAERGSHGGPGDRHERATSRSGKRLKWAECRHSDNSQLYKSWGGVRHTMRWAESDLCKVLLVQNNQIFELKKEDYMWTSIIGCTSLQPFECACIQEINYSKTFL